MHRLIAVPLLLFLAAASAPLPPRATLLDSELEQARAEARAADAQARKLEQAASRSRDEASRLRARQAAAAEAITAAEARISAATAEGRIIAATLAAQRERLRLQQRPVTSLLAGLAMMARRPPLLALAEGGSGTDEMVRVRLLLDSTLPVIRRRSAVLSAQLANSERLELAAVSARGALAKGREELIERQAQFARLEARALESAERSGRAAIGIGDVAIASGEDAERIAREAEGTRSAARTAAELAALGPVPRRLGRSADGSVPSTLNYRLPANARVVEGLGEIDASGIRSRGLTLATRRGAPVAVPASGIIGFAGPFRNYDGIVIIDHGGGWMSLLLNVSTQLRPGTRVSAGDPLGRATGPLGVELSRNGQHLSPALIAGSSAKLSNKSKGG